MPTYRLGYMLKIFFQADEHRDVTFTSISVFELADWASEWDTWVPTYYYKDFD